MLCWQSANCIDDAATLLAQACILHSAFFSVFHIHIIRLLLLWGLCFTCCLCFNFILYYDSSSRGLTPYVDTCTFSLRFWSQPVVSSLQLDSWLYWYFVDLTVLKWCFHVTLIVISIVVFLGFKFWTLLLWHFIKLIKIEHFRLANCDSVESLISFLKRFSDMYRRHLIGEFWNGPCIIVNWYAAYIYVLHTFLMSFYEYGVFIKWNWCWILAGKFQ